MKSLFGEMRHAVMLKAIDLFLDDDNSRDWHQETFDLYASIEENGKERTERMRSSRKSQAPMTKPLEQYVGNYSNEFLGDLKIGLSEDILTYQLNSRYKDELSHWHYDVFKIESKFSESISLIQFHLDQNGEVNGATVFGYEFEKME